MKANALPGRRSRSWQNPGRLLIPRLLAPEGPSILHSPLRRLGLTRLRKRPLWRDQECSLTELSALSVKAGQPQLDGVADFAKVRPRWPPVDLPIGAFLVSVHVTAGATPNWRICPAA